MGRYFLILNSSTALTLNPPKCWKISEGQTNEKYISDLNSRTIVREIRKRYFGFKFSRNKVLYYIKFETIKVLTLFWRTYEGKANMWHQNLFQYSWMNLTNWNCLKLMKFGSRLWFLWLRPKKTWKSSSNVRVIRYVFFDFHGILQHFFFSNNQKISRAPTM